MYQDFIKYWSFWNFLCFAKDVLNSGSLGISELNTFSFCKLIVLCFTEIKASQIEYIPQQNIVHIYSIEFLSSPF